MVFSSGIACALLAATLGLSQPELDRALTGVPAVRTERFLLENQKAAGRGVGAVAIERPIGEVWAVISRFDDKAEYMPRVKKVDILSASQGQLRVRMLVDASVTTARYTALFQLDQAAHKISFHLDKSAPDNTIADTVGSYELFALTGQRTLLLYRAYVDTGRAIPGFISDYMARRSMPKLLWAVKKRTETGGTYRK